RCVSKSWYCLLSDPNFILQNTRLFDDHGTIDDDKKARFMIICASSAVSLSYHTLQPVSPVLKLADLNPDLKLGLKVGGCCDGIFCLYRCYSASTILLWNPTTSDYRILPPLPQPQVGRIWGISMGFGYDPLTKDYKAVALVKCEDDHPRRLHSVYLYSLRKDSWKALCERGDTFSYQEVFQTRYSPATIERCYWFYWPKESPCSIASFDFSKHVFNTVALPPLPRRSGVPRYSTLSMSQDYLRQVMYGR
ncbi:Putative F-box protein At3g16210, partial [Linum grandiflorum]